MSNYNLQHQAYPAAGKAEAQGQGQGGYMVPAPPGHPVKDETPPGNTESRGGGFWRGCCAGLCCCCLLDACF